MMFIYRVRVCVCLCVRARRGGGDESLFLSCVRGEGGGSVRYVYCEGRVNYIQTFWNNRRDSEREQSRERETHTSRGCFLVFLRVVVFCVFFVLCFPIRRETGREATPLFSAFHHTIPCELPSPSRRRALFSFVESSKKKKERAAQQILKIASEQLFCGFCE